MAVTTTFDATNVSVVNDNTGFNVVKRDGTGGTPSAISEADVFLQGTGACSIKVSNQGIILWFDIGSGNELDFAAAGANENELIYIWVNMLAGGLMKIRNSITVPGLAIALGTGATGADRSFFAVDGSDTYPGGWVRYCIDPSKTVTMSDGAGVTLSSVRHIGMYCNTQPNVAKFDNLVIDRIDVGPGGLIATGTGTTVLDDMLLADEGTVNNKYGMLTSKAGIMYARGKLQFGDGTTTTDVSDLNQVIVFEDPQYYNGTAVVSCLNSTDLSIDVIDGSTIDTDLKLGTKIGTGDVATGINGVVFKSEGLVPSVSVLVPTQNRATSSGLFYGCSFEDLGAVSFNLNSANGTINELIGCAVKGCSQVNTGRAQVRATLFTGFSGTSAAFRWNDTYTNIKNSSFISNTDGTNSPGAIEHIISTAAPYDYDGLSFSDNDFDVRNSSGNAFTVNKLNESDPSTYTGAVVTFAANFVLTLTDLIQDTQVTIVNSSTRTELQNSLAPVGGTITYSHSGGETVDVLIIDIDYDPNVSSIYDLTLPNSSSTIKIGQIDDPNFSNP